MHTKLVLVTLTLTLSVPALTQDFRFTMMGSDNGGYHNTIDFGVNPLATFCADTALGEYNSPPPFPFMFTWTNPRETTICELADCFDCGRMPGRRSPHALDLRPYVSRTQVDTYRVSMYSYDGGFPIDITWSGDFSADCDSMMLIYSGRTDGKVVINMFTTSGIRITDPSVWHADIIRYGVKNPPLTAPRLVYPPGGMKEVPLTVRFRWRSISESTGYVLQVSTDSLFVSAVHTDSTLADTSKLVNALVAGQDYYWRTKAFSNGNESEWSEVLSFRTFAGSVSTHVRGRWNLLSVPVSARGSRTEIFPTASSGAYYYSGEGHGYEPCDSLADGVGYWLKFSGDQVVAPTGNYLESDTVSLEPGWNLVGSLSAPIAVNSVTSDPAGLVTSPFYKYTGRYEPSDSIHPGIGYWVRVNQKCDMFLSITAAAAAPTKNAIRIAMSGEMPPPAPEEVPDVALEAGKPTSYQLAQNYPNPFNPTTSLGYSLPVDGHVRLEIFDVMGQLVATLVDEYQAAGYKLVEFNAGMLPSGVYFSRIRAGNFTAARKLLLTR